VFLQTRGLWQVSHNLGRRRSEIDYWVLSDHLGPHHPLVQRLSWVFATQERKTEIRMTLLKVVGTSMLYLVLSRPSPSGDAEYSGTEAGWHFSHVTHTSVCCFVLLNRYWGIVMYGPKASS